LDLDVSLLPVHRVIRGDRESDGADLSAVYLSTVL
jgi:hypothetical protein